MRAALRIAAALSLLPAVVQAGDPRARRGEVIAVANCARCHAVGRDGTSPFRGAPPFRTLHRRYPVTDLAKALAEGIATGHATMPEFRLDPDEVESLITYLKTLER